MRGVAVTYPEKKIVVPEGMLQAVYGRFLNQAGDTGREELRDCLKAALRWLAENPIRPTMEQTQDLWNHVCSATPGTYIDGLVEWQRRMFFAPEPEFDPIAIASTVDLRWHNDRDPRSEGHNSAVLEAYRRGKESK